MLIISVYNVVKVGVEIVWLKKDTQYAFLRVAYFYFMCTSGCLHILMGTPQVLSFLRDLNGVSDHLSCSGRQLWVTMWMLRPKSPVFRTIDC